MSASIVAASAAGCAAAGLLVPQVAYRLSVPFGEPVRGACARCATPLPPGLRGWLPGPCRGCGVRPGPARWVTGGVAGLAGGALSAAIGPVAVLPLLLGVVVLGVLLCVIDLACRRLPDVLVLPALGVTPVLLAAVAAATGEWVDWLRGLAAFLAVGALLTGMALPSGGGLGLGDAKVGALLGWYLGWLGWEAVLLGVILPWLINAPLVLALLATGRVGWRTPLPFGPALLVGGLLAVLAVAGLGGR